MQKVNKIGVLSLAKVFGILYAIMGLIVGLILTFFSAADIPLATSELNSGIYGAASIILLPIIYGIMGFISGLITAFFYNLVANKIGGIEVEIK
tara:strand:+ start:9391 stop:9672 length:282 start_codon:yes stop_codon:yes gene_type:complete